MAEDTVAVQDIPDTPSPAKTGDFVVGPDHDTDTSHHPGPWLIETTPSTTTTVNSQEKGHKRFDWKGGVRNIALAVGLGWVINHVNHGQKQPTPQTSTADTQPSGKIPIPEGHSSVNLFDPNHPYSADTLGDSPADKVEKGEPVFPGAQNPKQS